MTCVKGIFTAISNLTNTIGKLVYSLLKETWTCQENCYKHSELLKQKVVKYLEKFFPQSSGTKKAGTFVPLWQKKYFFKNAFISDTCCVIGKWQ